jgi:hypothetical protein
MKCEHGVHKPSKLEKDKPNPFCTICTPHIPLTDAEKQQYRLMKKRWRD